MLSSERKKEIEAIADQIITDYNLNVPAFDLAKFLSKSEGFLIGEQPMEDGTTGILLVNDQDYIPNTTTHRLIAINQDLQNAPNFRMRRRYIAAHEYGHLVLHKKDDSKLFAHRDVAHQDSEEEQEADYFARCLLMPRNLILSIWDSELMKTVTEEASKISIVSRLFNVTPKKAEIRLRKDLCLL